MNRECFRKNLRLIVAALLAAQALLAGCQALSDGAAALFTTPTATVTLTPFPTRTSRPIETLPATFTPAPLKASSTPVPTSAVPELLAGFPLVEGAEIVVEDGAPPDPNSARVRIDTGQTSLDLEALFRKTLEQNGWTLRYAEQNVVGGFIQEWKKGQQLATVEYYFIDGKPAVSVDTRVVDSNRALALLLGFPLPNGTEVLRATGSSIELYVPENIAATVDFFKKEIAARRWRLVKIAPTGWCGALACLETSTGASPAQAEPKPTRTPTPDESQRAYYRAILPDYTEIDLSFLARGSHTRVYIQIHFLDLRRSGIPVALYPHAEITAISPGLAMFETDDALEDVLAFYQREFTGLGWSPYDFTIHQPDKYSRSWGKDPGRVVTLTLSASRGRVYGTLTCSTCKDPNFVFPSPTPTPIPSR